MNDKLNELQDLMQIQKDVFEDIVGLLQELIVVMKGEI